MKKVIFLLCLLTLTVTAKETEQVEQSQTIKLGGDLVTISFPAEAQIRAFSRHQCPSLWPPSLSEPVVCQQVGAFAFGFGKDKITKLGLTDILFSGIDPFGLMNDRESLKKRILVGTGMMIAGATIIATCPPIPVQEGWGDLSFSERLQNARAFGYMPPAIPLISEDVDNPQDPNSCTKTLDISIDENNNTVTDFLDFEGREFAYTSPFGTYPSATFDLAHTAGSLVTCLELSADLFNVSTNVNLGLPSLDGLPDVSLDGILDGLADTIIDAIGISDFEIIALQQFNGWTTNYRQDNPNYCDNNQCEFEHGLNRVIFDADINPASWGNLRPNVTYFQEVDVMEYFDPELTAFPAGSQLVVNLEALEVGGTRVDKYPPRSFVGSPPPDRSYLFDKSWLGVVDNCDLDPNIEMTVPNFLPLGIHDIPVTVTDRVGNQVSDFVRLIVDDTIPPDLLPQKPVGILVPDGTSTINFTDVGVGCDTYLCQGNPSEYDIYPPTYFDFGSITPNVACEMDNVLNQVSCDQSMLPVNDVSLVNWTISDPSGNETEQTQEVYVREESQNQQPTSNDLNFTVGQNNAIEIPLSATDGDYDPLFFSVLDQPDHGDIPGDPEAIFQTRFSSTGVLTDSDSITYITNGNAGTYGMMTSVGVEGMVYLFNLGGSGAQLINRYALNVVVPGGIKPHGITFAEGKNGYDNSDNLAQVLRNKYLYVGDWDAEKVYAYKYNDLSDTATVHELFSLPSNLQDPTGITAVDSGSNLKIYISDAYGDQLHWFEIDGSFNLVNNGYYNTGVKDPMAVDRAGTSSTDFYLTSLFDNEIVKYDINNGIEGAWPIDSLFDDPDGTGPALPIIQQFVDTVVEGDGSYFYIGWFDHTEMKYVKTRFQTSNQNQDPVLQGTKRFPSFVEVLSLEEVEMNGTTYFVVLVESDYQEQYLVRYNLAGQIDAIVSLFDWAESLNPLPPTSQTRYIDLALKDNGDVLLLEQGDSNNVPSITAIQLNSGVDEYQQVAGGGSIVVDFLRGGSLPYAIDVAANQVIVLGDGSIDRYEIGTLDDIELVDFPGAAQKLYGDISVSDAGVIYASYTQNNVIDTYDLMTGAPLGTFGLGELDFNADDKYGRLYYDNLLNKLWVSDFAEINYPDIGTHRMPRLLGFSDNGEVLNTLIPDGEPGNFFSFLEPGDFGTINAIASGDNGRFYVAETQPLNRLHVFDGQFFVEVACSQGEEGEVCNLLAYTPDNGYVGTETMTVIATDPFGSASLEATITLNIIDDTEAPVLTCPAPIEVQANSSGGYTANLDNPTEEVNEDMRTFLQGVIVTENTDLPPVVITHNIPVEIPLGIQAVTFTGTDGSGNQGTCDTHISVIDTIDPVIADAAEQTFEATAPLSDFASIGLNPPAATDNMAIDSVVSLVGTALPVGSHEITWRATDVAGNQAETTQAVVIEDTTPPVFSNTVNSDVFSNALATPIAYTLPTATDLVSTTVEVSCQPEIGELVPQGEVAVHCSAQDEAGNHSGVGFVVSVFGDDDYFLVANNQPQAINYYADTINGGTTQLTVSTNPDIVTRVYDGPGAEYGLVLGLMELNGNPAHSVSAQACNGDYIILEMNFEDLLFDDLTENFGDRLIVTCDDLGNAEKISSLVGNITVQQAINYPPTDTVVELDLTTANEISVSGRTLTANANNASATTIRVYGESYSLLPGQSFVVFGSNDLIFRDGFQP